VELVGGATLPRDVSISTPENVLLNYELSGLGSRSIAAATDMLIQGLILVLIGLLGVLVNLYSHGGITDLPRKWLTVLLILIAFVVFWGYYFYFEAYGNGQTIGKRAAGIRVVRDGGLPVDPTAAAVRNLVRFVDFLPGGDMVGAWSIFISPMCKRLGDYAAGTIVVKERVGVVPSTEAAVAPPPDTGLIGSVSAISSDEYQTVKRFVEREAELDPGVREQLAQRIAAPLLEKLQVDPSAVQGFSYPAFLFEVMRRCQEERGYL
jgi:uncharacterized RDD family membrane protein YckC